MNSAEKARFDKWWLASERTYNGTQCHEWQGGLGKDGYGVFWLNGTVSAHRTSYEHAVGPIPAGHVIDHLCRNVRCVNPAHLEAVVQAVNLDRAPDALATINKAKTHCHRGHALAGDNLYIHPQGGNRGCKACARIRSAAFKQRKMVTA